MKETLYAFDFKGNVLEAFGALTGTLSCAKAAEDIAKHASADRRMVVLRVDILCLRMLCGLRVKRTHFLLFCEELR